MMAPFRKAMSYDSAHRANLSTSLARVVLNCTRLLPRNAAPTSAVMTASKVAAWSIRQTTISSVPCAAAATLDAIDAPALASGSAFAGVRFHAVTRNAFASRESAKACPILRRLSSRIQPDFFHQRNETRVGAQWIEFGVDVPPRDGVRVFVCGLGERGERALHVVEPDLY